MAKWELAIACRNEIEEYRKKEGDIISFKLYPHGDWGKKGELNHLIIIVDGLTEKEVGLMKQPQFEGNKTQEEIAIEEENYRIAVKGTALEDVPFEFPKPIAKRRFAITLNRIKRWYPDLDLSRVRDINDRYQPFYNNGIIIDFNEKVAICHDKHTGTCKYIQEK